MWSLYWSKSTHTETPGIRIDLEILYFLKHEEKITRSGLLSLFGQEDNFTLLLNYPNFCQNFVQRL